MIASFLFDFSEEEILKLGIFINLAGIIGCLLLGKIEDKTGSEKIVIVCIIFLMFITTMLYFTNIQFFLEIVPDDWFYCCQYRQVEVLSLKNDG